MTTIRETILAADDIESDSVTIPAWNVTLEVRGMDGASRARFLNEFADDTGRLDFERLYPEIIVACAFDPYTGEQVFTSDDHALLMAKSGAAVETLALAAMRVSGLGEKGESEAGKDSSESPTATDDSAPSVDSTSS